MYDIHVFMHVCIYHKHMYVCMNHAYVCLIVLFLLSLLHTHTRTYHTVFSRIRSQCLTYHTKYAKYESTCSAIWSRPRSHFRPCLASHPISENFARKQVFFFVFRGSRYFFFPRKLVFFLLSAYSRTHQHRHMCVS